MGFSWRRLARCRDYDPELFYPGDEADSTPAKLICGSCAVREACLEFALGNPVGLHGVWGAMSEAERDSMTLARIEAITENSMSA